MADRAVNPIPFNPDTMTLSQIKEAAETLSMIFRMVGGSYEPEMIVENIKGYQEALSRKWNR